MDIRSVMTANPACCGREATLQEVAQLMKRNDCGQIPVVDDGNKPVGVITDRDIAVRAVAEGTDTRNATAADYMSAPVATVRDNSSIDDCYRLMEQNQIRRVVVVDNQGNVAGIVAQADIALSGRDAKTAEVVKQVSTPG
ncbi:MAG TPA: CBS domain-containing protein [Xanthomonadaceae bacterium]|nr:CBS domain-containing protein [Xanthomonadaceae bacterium]